MTISLILMREVFMMALLICLGIYTKKSGMLTEDTARRLSDLLLAIIMPVLLINTLQREKNPELMPGFWGMLGLSAFAYFISVIIASFVYRRKDGSDTYQMERLAAVMPNVGYMGIPLLLATTGQDTLIYCAAVIGTFQLAVWCWAVPMLEGNGISIKKLVVNPGVLAFAAGLLLFLLEIRLPVVITSFMTQLSGLNTPVSMLMIGIFLADVKLRNIFCEPSIYKAVLLRNIAIPVLVVLIIRVMGLTARFGKDFSMTAAILFSCSSAAAVLLLPLKAGKSGDFASRAVAASTFFLIFTLPLVAFIAEKVL